MDANQHTFSYLVGPLEEGQSTDTPPGELPNLLEVPDPWASRSSSPTHYEFITTTGEESTASTRRKLKTVRSHVMKNFLQQQQRQRGQSTEPTVASSSRDSERRRGKQRARSSRSVSSEVESQLASSADVGGNRAGAPDFTMMVSNVSTFVLPESAGTPEAMRRQTQAASSFFRPEPVNQANENFALEFFWSPSPPDDASNFSQLQLDSICWDKMQGRLEPSVETLNYIGETVRTVMETLQVCGRVVPQSVIFAVSRLALGSITHGECNQAKSHLDAMKRIVDLKGGISILDFELQRTITWTSYIVESAQGLPPTFPCPLFANVKPFPLAFQDECSIRAWRTTKRFPKDSSFLFDVVLRMHQIGLATSSEWFKEIDQRSLSNAYFEAKNALLTIQASQPWLDSSATGARGHENNVVYGSFVIGLLFYIWASVRHLRGTIAHESCEAPYKRLRMLLENSQGTSPWPRGKSLEPVLTALCYSMESCEPQHFLWRDYFLKESRRVAELLKIRSEEEFLKTMDQFPSTDGYKRMTGGLWREIVESSA